MKLHPVNIIFVLLLAMVAPVVAQAHFIWLVHQVDKDARPQLHLYFGELAEADDPELLDHLSDVKAWRIDSVGKTKEIKLAKGSDSLMANLGGGSDSAMYAVQHDWGVFSRGDEPFLLRYYAKTGPELSSDAWRKIDCGKQLALDLIPRRDGDQLRITVKWQGEPIAGAQVKALGPGIEDLEAESNDKGEVAFALGKQGTYSIRARHVEDQAGSRDGKEFASTKHYSTLALQVGAVAAKSTTSSATSAYPSIPQMVTSFGAAIAGDALYVYGGHTGRAHAYYKEAQANTLRRLNLKNAKAWESLGEGPGLQGLAMVAHGGKLYRIGGFTAKNKDGEDHDLWSQADVSCYDPATKLWTDVSPLPEPRSSFDAAVLGDKIYVVGGWQMSGDTDKIWHKTAYVLNLAADTPQWEALPEPPFQRRALSVAAHEGKIYAIGGMQQEGGPTTRTDVLDSATGKWSQGASLQGKPMDGFGSSAFATGGRLYVTTYSGKLQQLTKNGAAWEVVAELERDRFFHRMLPLSDTQLVSLGGASMSEGKFEEIDVIDVSSVASSGDSISAPDLLFRARKARAIWKDFPGFASDICVNIDGEARCGQITVASDGEVALSGFDLEDKPEVLRSLTSLFDHRLGGAKFEENVSYADDDVDHPLGRLLNLDYDSRMASTYRVKGDIIAQVNRKMGGARFTISVFSVHRNKEDEVLPESYNVCFWNKDGSLKSSTTVRDEWTRVRAFDLPSVYTSVTAGKDSSTNVRVEFRNHKLTKASE